MPLTPEEQKELQGLESEFGNLTPDELGEMRAIEQSFAGTSYLDRLAASTEMASQKATELQNLRRSGEIGQPQYAYRMAGEVAAPLIGAPVGAAIGEAGELVSNIDLATGGYGRKAIGKIGETKAGQFVGNVLSAAGEGASEFAQKHPELTGIANATLNIGTLGVPFAKYGDDVLEGTYKAIKNINPKEYMRYTADELREKGGQMFELASRTGGGVKPELWQDFIKDAQRKITKQIDEPWLKKLSQVGGESSALDDALQILSEVPDDPRSFSAIKKVDEILGDLAEKNINNKGQYTRQGKDFLTLQMTLRDKVEKAADDMFIGKGKEALNASKEARKLWSASYRLDDIDRIMASAEGARQPTTIIKNGFRRIRDNPKKFKKYTPEEQFYIKKAAQTGVLEGINYLGSSRLMPIAATGLGVASSGPAGAAAAIPAELMRRGASQVGTEMALKKGEDAARAVISTATGQNAPQVYPYLMQAGKGAIYSTAPMGAVEAQRQESLMERARRLFLEGK